MDLTAAFIEQQLLPVAWWFQSLRLRISGRRGDRIRAHDIWIVA
jgi:hypothetical protein